MSQNGNRARRVGLYLRVSTDEQTIENQRQALHAAAAARGWTVVEEFTDAGISGANGREKRPGFDKLLKAITRRRIDVVAACVDLYLDRQAVDTTTPAGRALFQMLGVFAEFERAIIVDRVNAGIARARVRGTKSGRPIGRPPLAPERDAAIRAELARGTGILRTVRLHKTGVSVVQRIKAEMTA